MDKTVFFNLNFYWYFFFQVTEDDQLPKQFCYDCIIKIESSFTYITEAHKVDATLKNIISRTNTSIIVETETNSRRTDNLNLTLPDYKICVAVDNYDEQVIFDSIDLPASDTGQINAEKSLEVECIQNVTEVEEGEDISHESVKETVTVEETKKNVCPVCRKAFTSKTWFNKHMKKEHTEHKYACAHCPKSMYTTAVTCENVIAIYILTYSTDKAA